MPSRRRRLSCSRFCPSSAWADQDHRVKHLFFFSSAATHGSSVGHQPTGRIRNCGRFNEPVACGGIDVKHRTRHEGLRTPATAGSRNKQISVLRGGQEISSRSPLLPVIFNTISEERSRKNRTPQGNETDDRTPGRWACAFRTVTKHSP